MADLTLQTLIEFRTEMREFRDETRKAQAQHDHRLNLLTEQMRDQSNRFAQVETHMAALLATGRTTLTAFAATRAQAFAAARAL